MGNKIIVALDGISEKKAIEIAKRLKGLVWGFKVNDLLFESPGIIKRLKRFGKVFADAKLHDIPSTVANSVSRLSRAGADLITVHASGGIEMMKAAKKNAGRSKIIAVTVLTSLKDTNNFARLIKDIKAAGVDGIVCSAHELKLLKKEKSLKIVPGIRPSWHKIKDDQSRVATPLEAVNLGADLLVIGRPITKSNAPRKALERIKLEIHEK